MRMKMVLLLMVAAGAAVLTVGIASSWLHIQRASFNAQLEGLRRPAQTVETRMVLVAKEQLPAGTFLKSDNLRWVAFPEEGITEAYYTREEGEDAAEAVFQKLEGAVVRTGLTEGEPLTRGRIVRPGDRGFLAAVLRPDMRAVSVPINATTGIAGFVFPGDNVDLLLTHKLTRNDIVRRATETLLRNVRVLAVDQRVNDQQGKPVLGKTATLEVTSKQAEVIAVALDIGRLSLALRSLSTETEAAPVAADLTAPSKTYTWDSQASQLIGRPAGATTRTQKVRVVRGGESSTVSFVR